MSPKDGAWLFFFILLAILAVVMWVLWLRHRNQQLEHQERMSALEKGTAVVPAGRRSAPWSPRVYLLRGLMWSFTGAALIIALLGISASSRRPHQPMTGEWTAMEARHVSQQLDIPIDQARDIVNKDEATRAGQIEGMPATVALLGLIPLAVGLAYLVFYYTGQSGKMLPADAPSNL